MAEFPRYAILGNGRWGAIMRSILRGEDRRAEIIPGARQDHAETIDAYRSRISASLKSSGAQVAWLCVPPGSHIRAMVEAALLAGLHVVVEKPWMASSEDTAALTKLAQAHHKKVAVHFEYCFLDEIESWRRQYQQATDQPRNAETFGGTFLIDRPGPASMTPLQNLGCHLLAMRNYAVPQFGLSEIACGYEKSNRRSVWLQRGNNRFSAINFLNSKEPIIQRFVNGFENALNGAEFPFDLEFALQVAKDVAALEAQVPPESNSRDPGRKN